MSDRWLAEMYALIIHCDVQETIPLAAAGYTVFREESRSDSFPKRTVKPEENGLVIEYALYWDFDIQHMYDLEHIWVWVAAGEAVCKQLPPVAAGSAAFPVLLPDFAGTNRPAVEYNGYTWHSPA